MIRYALRLHRWAVIAYGAILALNLYVQGATYDKIAGTTAAARGLFARQLTPLGPQYSYLIALPHHLETLAGYVWWKAWTTVPIAAAIWAVSSATGAVRGDEDKALVDSWIAARVSRGRLVVTRLTAFSVASAIVAVGAGLGMLAGAAGIESVGLDRVAEQSLVFWLVTIDLFALCFLVAQIPSSKRLAQGTAAGVLVVLFVINAAARTAHSLDGVAWISPFHWFDVSQPIVPGGTLDPLGLALSVLTVIAAGGLSIVLFRLRDVGGSLFRLRLPERAAREAPASRLLRPPVVRLLYRQRVVLLIWTIAVALMAVYMASISHQIIDQLLAIPGLRAFLSRGTADPYKAFIAIFWFNVAQLLIAGFAVHLVSFWASDDGDGVLAAELSQPRRRWAIVLERFVAAMLGIVMLAVIGSIVATLVARAGGTTLDIAAVTRATALLVPFALTFSAVGAVGSVWWPRASVGVLGMVVFLSYLINELGPVLQWPTWAVNASPFALYGTPLLEGVYWNGFYIMAAIVLAGFALATYLMERRELTD